MLKIWHLDLIQWGLEETKINFKHTTLQGYGGKEYDAVIVTIESGLKSISVHWNILNI